MFGSFAFTIFVMTINIDFMNDNKTLLQLFNFQFVNFEKEIMQTPEEHLWRIMPGIRNSIGHLCLHICGNLRHFIGKECGGIDYVRDREREFNSPAIEKNLLLDEIKTTGQTVEKVLIKLSPEILEEQIIISFQPFSLTKGQFIIHLLSHMAYHIGQINYLRRILAGTQ